MVVTDVNGDGYPDLFIPSQAGDAPLVYYGDGALGFNPVVIEPLSNSLLPGFAGDINGDGRVDLGVMPTSGFIYYSPQDASGQFDTFQSVYSPYAGSGFSLGGASLTDINGDGRPDFLTVFNDASSGLVLSTALNLGAGQFQHFTQQAIFKLPYDTIRGLRTPVLVAQFDGDPLPDVILIHPDDNLVEIIHNRTSTTPVAVPVTLSAGVVTPVNFEDMVAPAKADLNLTIPAAVGPVDYTVSYKNGNVEVRDSALGLVSSRPLAEVNSLSITAPDGRPVSLTIDESNGTFSLPGGISFVGSALAANTVRLIAGPGNDAIGISDSGATLNGRPIVSWANLDQLLVSGGGGNDFFSVSGDPHARGRVNLVGGPGANTYAIASLGANLAVVESTNRGSLNFSSASSGLSIDLRMAQGQPQAIGAGGNTLALYGLIANLTGTPYDDRILANDLDNVIHALGGNDVIYGFGGNDILDGGDGNDLIVTGAGNSILLGGAGDDVLIAGPGRNLLIGGAGRDRLLAGGPMGGKGKSQGGSILIAGETAYDANDAALRAILAEWTSSRSRFARVHNLLNGRGSKHRSNGSVFLNSKTIKDDRTLDNLVGDSRHDWFRPGRGDKLFHALRRP